MTKLKKKYEQLTLSDDFIFAKVMSNKDLCKELLEVILEMKIDRIEYPERQKVIDIARDAHGVRLDVYAADDKYTVYNVEMQSTDTGHLPKRSRYYQGMIDLNLIEKGENYKQLNKSYVIFICTFDLFGKGRHIYTFENLCLQDTDIHLNDGTTKVFLNPYSDMDDVSERLKNFLKFLIEDIPVDEFTKQLNTAVKKAQDNREWRREYMTLSMKFEEMMEEGFELGKQEGLKQGKQEGLQQGLQQSRIMLFSLVSKGALDVKDAAEQMEMTEEEFQNEMKKNGY